MDEHQSAILDIAPSSTPEIEETLTTKNALATILNRVKHIEQEAEKLYTEASYLRKTIKEFLDE